MKKKFFCFLAFLVLALFCAACSGGRGTASLPVTASGSGQSAASAPQEDKALIGKELQPSSSGDGLYDKICRCLYPYLITQSGHGYDLFCEGSFSQENYLSLLNYIILQEHRDQVKKEGATEFGQPVFYFEKAQYEKWYEDYSIHAGAGPLDLDCEIVGDVECVPVAEMGWGSVQSYTIKSIDSEPQNIYSIKIQVSGTETEDKLDLFFSVRLDEETFQYLSVQTAGAE